MRVGGGITAMEGVNLGGWDLGLGHDASKEEVGGIMARVGRCASLKYTGPSPGS